MVLPCPLPIDINHEVFDVLGGNWDPTDNKFSSVSSYRQDLLPTCKAFCKETTVCIWLSPSDFVFADDATSPPPFGHRAFARKAARQPFAALQLCQKQSEASPTATAGSAHDTVLMTSSSPLPAVAAKQLRSK